MTELWKISDEPINGSESTDIRSVNINKESWKNKFPLCSLNFLRITPGENYSDTRIITHIPSQQRFSIYSNRGEARVREILPTAVPSLIDQLIDFLKE